MSYLVERCYEPVSNGEHCLQPLPCPRHSPAAKPASDIVAPESGTAGAKGLMAARRAAEQRPDPRKLAAEVLDRVIKGTAAPLAAARFVRAGRIMEAMGASPQDNDDLVREAYFRGRIAHGLPPRSDDEWEFARSIFTTESLNEFARWAVMLEAPFPADLNPPGGRSRRQPREPGEHVDGPEARDKAAWQALQKGDQ